MNRTIIAASAAAFLGCILAANYVTTEHGMAWVFGLTATAGTYFAGATFILRDTLQKSIGTWPVLALIAVGAALSYFVSDPFIAFASAVAFGVSELADLLIWTPLEKKGYIRAAFASNTVGAVVDTVRHCAKNTCANCLHYALAWRERVLRTLDTRQFTLTGGAA